MLPDAISSDIRLIDAFHGSLKRFVIVTIKRGEIETVSTFVNQRIVIVRLFEIKIVLAVVRVGRDELAADGPMDFPQDRFYLGEQVVSGNPTQLLDAWLIEA